MKGSVDTKRYSLIVFAIILGLIIIVIPWLWRIFYPYPYRESVLSCAQEFSLAPNLILAITRVESKFRPKAVSPKGARGLMQLMPETAEWAARQMGIEYSLNDLFDPEYNLKIGCWYLANLLHDFQGNLPAALAAYNGGRGKVKQWIGENTWDGTLENISQIPYQETKVFVEKVIHDLKIYNSLY